MKDSKKLSLENLNKILENSSKHLSLFFTEKNEREREFALCLWRVIREYSDNLNQETRLKFLSQFSESGKKITIENEECVVNYMKIVFLVESLPTIVWRKFLWVSNSDFTTFESFLRRLSKKQVVLLEKTSKEILSQTFPSFLNKKEIEEIKRKDYLENFYKNGRYLSKGAWSYNLLGLDFGYNAYKNEHNDEKIESSNVLKFLSLNNHSEDFIVNEDGKYFKYYKLVRSNYVWFSKKKVSLKSHICPGFWITFLMLFWFFILSPVSSLVLIGFIGFPHSQWIQSLPFVQNLILGGMGFFAFLTPLWLILAGVKKIFTTFAKGKGGNAIKEMIEHLIISFGEDGEKLIISLSSMIFIILIFLLSSFLYLIPSIFISSVIVIWFGHWIYSYLGKGFVEYPKLRQFWNSLFIITATVMIAFYPKEFITFLLFIFEAIVSVASLLFSKFGWFLLILIPTFFSFYFNEKLKKLELKEDYLKLNKFSTIFEKSFFFLLWLFLVLLVFPWIILIREDLDINLILMGLVLFSFLFPFLILKFLVHKKTKIYLRDPEFIKEVKRVLREMNTLGFTFSDSQFRLFLNDVFLNSFFKRENFREEYIKLFEIFSRNFLGENRIEVLRLVIRKYDKKTFYKLKELFETKEYISAFASEKELLIWSLVVYGTGVKKAIKEFNKKEKMQEEKEKKFKEIKSRLFFYLKITFFPIFFLYKLILSFLILKKIWEKFNESCPYVYRPKKLS